MDLSGQPLNLRRDLYPHIEPYDSGFLNISGVHTIYYEQSENPHGHVLRNGWWSEEESAILVLGDIISVKLGDIIPADARLHKGDPLKIDQSALTGESLPVTKGPADRVYSGAH